MSQFLGQLWLIMSTSWTNMAKAVKQDGETEMQNSGLCNGGPQTDACHHEDYIHIL